MSQAQARTYRNALPLNSMLFEYKLEAVLGAGGFGMTYLGWDTNLEKHVAIKEYLPGELTVRALDGSVVPVNTDHEYNYKWGLERFIQEARTLAKFSHPNIVRVNRYFVANGTSYMVMDYEAGESLYQYLRHHPQLDEATLKTLLMPILDGLQEVHKAGFLHRDIKPSNVFIRENGTPVLLDFGSASLAGRGSSKRMAPIVSPGYAPLEQYTHDGHQGPWSDIYSLSAVVYRAVTHENPPNAVSRLKTDNVRERLAAARLQHSERFLRAIEWGMMLDERVRPQSVAEWSDVFFRHAPLTALNHVWSLESPGGTLKDVDASKDNAATRRSAPAAGAHRFTAWFVASGIFLVALVALGLMWSYQLRPPQPAATPAVAPAMPAQQHNTQTMPSAAP